MALRSATAREGAPCRRIGHMVRSFKRKGLRPSRGKAEPDALASFPLDRFTLLLAARQGLMHGASTPARN